MTSEKYLGTVSRQIAQISSSCAWAAAVLPGSGTGLSAGGHGGSKGSNGGTGNGGGGMLEVSENTKVQIDGPDNLDAVIDAGQLSRVFDVAEQRPNASDRWLLRVVPI